MCQGSDRAPRRCLPKRPDQSCKSGAAFSRNLVAFPILAGKLVQVMVVLGDNIQGNMTLIM
jgi:hypothetical protein